MTKNIAHGRIVDTETGEIEEPEGEELSRRAALGILDQYVTLRAERDRIERTMKRASETLKSYIEQHGELYDGERRIRAFLQTRKGGDVLDSANLPEPLLRWLADQHCLVLKADRWKALDGAAPEVLRVRDYLSPGPGSVALQVKEEEDS